MSSIGKYRLALSGAIILSVLAHLVILWNSIPHIASGHGDFGIFYTGAQILHAGRGAELYDPNVQQAYQDKFLAPSTEWNLPFNHAPYELLIFLPLVYFSYPIAFLIWGLFNLLLLALACRHLISFIHPDHRLLLGAFLFARRSQQHEHLHGR